MQIFIKKVITLGVLLVLPGFLMACGSRKETFSSETIGNSKLEIAPMRTIESISTEPEVSTSNDYTAGIKVAGEPEDDAVSLSTDQAVWIVGEQSDAKPNEIIVNSVRQYIATHDIIYLDGRKRALLENSEAVDMYDSFLQKKLPEMYESSGRDVRMALGWLDEDDTPELFLCQSDATASGVSIYFINEAAGKVQFLGEFSQFGNCVYTERENRIWSQYGNQGYYQECVSMIDDGEPRLIGSFLIDGSGVKSDEVLYYANYPIAEQLTGTRGDMDFGLSVFEAPGEQFRVDEEEYDKAYHVLMCDTENNAIKVVMDYNYMVPIRNTFLNPP